MFLGQTVLKRAGIREGFNKEISKSQINLKTKSIKVETRNQPKTWYVTFLLCILFVLYWDHTALAFSGAQSSDDEDLQIEQMLDDLMGEDPSIISEGAFLEKEPKQEIKTHCCELMIGAGRKTNVLGSSELDLDSNLMKASLDYSFTSGASQSSLWNVYSFYEQTAYLDLDVEGSQYLFLTWIQNKRALTESSFWGFDLDYIDYTSFDTSNAEEDKTLPQLRVQEISIAPFWESVWDKKTTLLIELPLSRYTTDETADEYNSLSLSVSVIKKYQERSDFQVKIKTDQRHYTEGETPDLDGNAIDGQKLQLTINSIGLQNNHYSINNPNWMVKSDIELKNQRDNGPGYYNFNGFTIIETLQYLVDRWKFEGKGALRILRYTERTIDSSSKNKEKMFIQTTDIGLALEKKFTRSLSLKAEIKQFNSASNDDAENYSTGALLVAASMLF